MTDQPDSSDHLPPLPESSMEQLLEPLIRFLHVEAAGGLVLLGCAVVALVMANSPWAEAYLDFWKTPIGFEAGGLQVRHSLQHWINDALMAVFFFVVGLEVKREFVLGELREVRSAMLPVAAALGGMIVPATLYLILQQGTPAQPGWGIPMATDIAFVVGCMALLGPRVPHGLRVMLLSLAIVDDIGAIVVIAVGYTERIDLVSLALGGIGVGAVIGLIRLGVRNMGVYMVLAILVWFAFHESGVHATIAGLILGLATPVRSWVSRGILGQITSKAADFLSGERSGDGESTWAVLRHVERASREAVPPLERIEAALHPWVSFLIMPLFALANAGVAIRLTDLGSPVAWAVVAGLVLGKPVGIMVFSWIAVRSGAAALPDGVGWGKVLAAGCLAGIGFTMAIFIAGLAFADTLLDQAKVGILVGSGLSAALGAGMMIGSSSPGTAASDTK